MKRRTATLAVLTGLGAVVLAFAVPFALTAARFEPAAKAPSDAAMIAHWEKHRRTLDDITDMLRRDPALNRLGLAWSDPDDPERAHVPAARIADYRDLMREASVISVSRGHRSVQFLFYSSRVSVNGFGKSFVRGEPSRYAEIVDGDLDRAAAGRNKILLQRPIADGWWLQRDGN
ncbi:MAG: hypothetical protein AB7V13_17095 [Pseudorhodoplanes sp.]|uniref:hypothetical protein n=1 Tax=Pseudorhodoplanes sp. TaxID=1934341 RepID=UPI003D0D5CDA